MLNRNVDLCLHNACFIDKARYNNGKCNGITYRNAANLTLGSVIGIKMAKNGTIRHRNWLVIDTH